MVDRFPGPGEEGQLEPQVKPQEESVFSKHLRKLGILGEKSKETTEEDDDEEKPKKFRKFFKGLFRNVVQPPVQPETPEADESRRPPLESLFFAWHDQAVETPLEPAEANEQTSKPEALYIPRQEANEAPESTDSVEENTHRENILENSSVGTSIEYPVGRHPEQPVERRLDQEANLMPWQENVQPAGDVTRFEQRLQSPTQKEKEVVIERGPGMALPVVLVGAEYFARKRADKKLERTFSRKVESLEETAKQDNLVRSQLETIVKQNRDQLDSLKRERGIAVERTETARTPEARTIIERKVETQKWERTPEVQSSAPKMPERMPLAERPEKIESYKIMEQVADAAEHDVPVERVFERSHEVKDDKSVSLNATSIGSIMAAQAEEQKRLAKVQALQRQMGDPSQGLPIAPDTPELGMYRQAVRSGFVAGVVIIIFGLLAYLLK